MTSKTAPAGISAIVTEGSGEIYLDVLQDGRAIRVGPVDRRSLLAALGAEPDESDYTEVVEENNRLSRKLSAALRDRDANRAERDAARRRIQALLPDRDSWKARAEEVEQERDEARSRLAEAAKEIREQGETIAELAAEELREDQGQIDRSWALERAGEVLGRLAAVGIDAKACGVSLLPVAEWILGGEAEDRG